MDTDVNVSVTWTGPRTIPGERDSVMETSGSGGTYTGSLTISPLAEGQDDGQYTCSVAVSGGSNVLEATNSDSTTIDIIGKTSIQPQAACAYSRKCTSYPDTTYTTTVDWEIFGCRNFHLLNFCVTLFSTLDSLMKYF